MTPETRLASQLQLWCGKRGYIMIRQQSGLFYDQTGNLIRIGFPGLSDYLVIGNGQVCFCELKVKPNRPTKEQLHFIEVMHQHGIRAGVVYCVEDLEKLISL